MIKLHPASLRLLIPTVIALVSLRSTVLQAQSGAVQMTDDRTVFLDVDKFYDMQYGYAVIEKNGRTALIDQTGKLVIDYDGPYYPSKKGFINGMLAVTDPVTKKSGFVNTDLKLVFPCQFDSPSLEFNEFGRCGLGPPAYGEYVVLFTDGTKRNAPTKTQVRGIRTPGHPWASKGYKYKDDYLTEVTGMFGKGNGSFGVIGKDFLISDFARIVVEYREAKPALPDAKSSPFSSSHMVGYVNWAGLVVIQPHYVPSNIALASETSHLFQGLVWLGLRQDDTSVRWALIDSTGSQIGTRTYAKEPASFTDGFSYAAADGSFAIIDRTGNIVHEFKSSSFGRITKITTRELPLEKAASFAHGNATYFVYGENFRKEVKDAWIHCSATCNEADRLPFSPTPGWSTTRKGDVFLVEVEHRWDATDKRPFAQRGGGSSRRVGYVDENGKWLIPPVHSSIGLYDVRSGLVRTTITYGGASGAEPIEGFVDRCGYFPIAKKPKEKW